MGCVDYGKTAAGVAMLEFELTGGLLEGNIVVTEVRDDGGGGSPAKLRTWPEDDGCVAVSSNMTPGSVAGWSLAAVVADWRMACCISFLTKDRRSASESVREDARGSPQSPDCDNLEGGGVAEPRVHPRPRPLIESEGIGTVAARVAARSDRPIGPTPAPRLRPRPLPQHLPGI